jgi:hypothetical protein
MNLVRLTGILLLILVGYHFINQPLGFSLMGGIATGVFALCLTTVYRGYAPDRKNSLGWGFIVVGCLLLGNLSSMGPVVLFPLLLVFAGIWLAELPLGKLTGDGDAGGFDGDSCGGDGGD